MGRKFSLQQKLYRLITGKRGFSKQFIDEGLDDFLLKMVDKHLQTQDFIYKFFYKLYI